ncbi:hypothetical protein D3C71_1460240 [compost metagenome]
MVRLDAFAHQVGKVRIGSLGLTPQKLSACGGLLPLGLLLDLVLLLPMLSQTGDALALNLVLQVVMLMRVSVEGDTELLSDQPGGLHLPAATKVG